MLYSKYFRLPRLTCAIGIAMGLTSQTTLASPLASIIPIQFTSGDIAQYEYYDNISGEGGGVNGSYTIRGNIVGYTYTPEFKVSGMIIRASITNDMPSAGSAATGTNTHGESGSNQISGTQTLTNTKLTVEFADDGTQGNFSVGGANLGPESNIYAINYDDLAWYSYPLTGAYHVPTFNFGIITPGSTVTRDLSFGFYSPVEQAVLLSLNGASDIFMNRSTDLKIGDYFEKGGFEGLAADDGTAYPSTLFRSGNVSVFATPEPGTLSLLLTGLFGFSLTKRPKNQNSKEPD